VQIRGQFDAILIAPIPATLVWFAMAVAMATAFAARRRQ
jgi:hypothetical protein